MTTTVPPFAVISGGQVQQALQGREKQIMEVVETCGADGLPFNTRYGNGDAIGEDVVREINAVYDAATTREPWRAGDLLLVDNVRCAHSREPFEGAREVLVALAEPVRAG